MWIIFVKEDPSKDKRISYEEYQYITEQMADIKKVKVNIEKLRKTIQKNHLSSIIISFKIADTPWRQMLTSVPFWTIIVTHVMKLSVMYTILNELPKYLQGPYSHEYHFHTETILL